MLATSFQCATVSLSIVEGHGGLPTWTAPPLYFSLPRATHEYKHTDLLRFITVEVGHLVISVSCVFSVEFRPSNVHSQSCPDR